MKQEVTVIKKSYVVFDDTDIALLSLLLNEYRQLRTSAHLPDGDELFADETFFVTELSDLVDEHRKQS